MIAASTTIAPDDFVLCCFQYGCLSTDEQCMLNRRIASNDGAVCTLYSSRNQALTGQVPPSLRPFSSKHRSFPEVIRYFYAVFTRRNICKAKEASSYGD